MDLNGDGIEDLLTAAYGGMSYIAYRNADGSFKKFEALKDKCGDYVSMGTCYNKKGGDKFDSPKQEQQELAAFVHAVDWDNDGDYDLLLSEPKKGVKLCLNEGNSKKAVFSDRPFFVMKKHIVNTTVDWDGDGLWDIVAGNKNGGVYFYKNTGKLGKPKFEKAVCIIEGEKYIDQKLGGNCGLTLPSVTDYNNDGKLDIISGCCCRHYKPGMRLSKEEIKKKEAIEKEFDEVMERSSEIIKELDKKYKDLNKLRKAIHENEEYKRLSKRNSELFPHIMKYSKIMNGGGYVFISLGK